MKILEGITRNVLVLGVVSFLTDVSSEMVFPILPLFLSLILGAGKEAIGLVEGVADSVASLMDIFFGYWSDRSGRRKELTMAGYGLSSVVKAGLLFATSWVHVLLVRGTERIGKSMRTSPRDAIIAASTDEKNRGRAFGLHRAMDTFGAVLGPIVAYLVFASMGQGENAFRTLFLIALAPALLAVIVIALFVKEPEKPVQREKKPLFWESLRMLSPAYKRFLAVSCLFSLAYFSFALLIVRANDIGLSAESALLAYIAYNVSYLVASVPAGTLSDKIGRKPVIAGSFVLYGLISLGFIIATGFWQVVGLFVVYGIFVATDESVNKAFISDMTEDKTRGIALGAYNTAVGAVYLPANAIFGAMWAVLGAEVAFGAAAAVAILAGVLMLIQK